MKYRLRGNFEMKHPTIDNKMRLSEKVSYGLVILGNIPLMTLISSFLLIFYTNVIGLDPGKVATLFLVARICDGISDPIMGILVDRMPRTKLGRIRPVLILGTIICSINYLLLWFGPAWVSTGKMVVVYVTYLLLGFTFDLMDIAGNSLLPVMTENPKERTSLSTIAGAVQMIGAIALSIAAPLILGDASKIEGYYTLITIALCIVVVGSIGGALGVRERVQPESDEKYSLKQLLQILLLRPVWALFLLNLLYNVGSNLVATSQAFFFTYIVGNLDMMAAVSGLAMVGLIPGILISGFLTNRFGRKAMAMIGLLIAAAAPLLRYIDVSSVKILMISSVIGAVGTGFIMPVRLGIAADNTDYVEYKTGQRAEGAISSLSSFAVKCASGIGGALPGYILALCGFQKDVAVQSSAANQAIIFTNVLLPVIFYLLAFAVFAVCYPITKAKMKEITEHLKEKRS